MPPTKERSKDDCLCRSISVLTHHNTHPTPDTGRRRTTIQSTTMAAAAAQPSIFDVISRGDLAEVQRRVGANPAVVEQRLRGSSNCTPLMWAILEDQPAIALWLIEHRGGHDINTQDDLGLTAIHDACWRGPLEVVHQLVAAGADVAAMAANRRTALIVAAYNGHVDIVTYLLTFPAIRDGIDSIDAYNSTALSFACSYGRTSIVQLLLDAGADPTTPLGNRSPLSIATYYRFQQIVALLRPAIEQLRFGLLHMDRWRSCSSSWRRGPTWRL